MHENDTILYTNLVRTLHNRVLFLCQNLGKKGEMLMFTDIVLEKLFAIKEMQKLTLADQSMLIDAFEEIMEEEEKKHYATVPEP